MLKKLFSYDFRFIGKSMWLFTVIVFAMTLLGCGAAVGLHNIEWSGNDIPSIAKVSGVMLLGITVIASYVALVAYGVLATIMVLRRYYTNLFTDEGYLTFTLPVKSSSILNAKILSGGLWTLIAAVIEIVCFAALAVSIFTPEGIKWLADELDYLIFALGAMNGVDGYLQMWLYLGEYVIIGIAGLMYELLLIYVCITLASIVVKKARIVLGVGIYFGVNSVIGALVSIVSYIMSTVSTAIILQNMDMTTQNTMNMLNAEIHIQLGFSLLVYIGVSLGAYFLNKHLLKNKLNLS